MTSGGRDSATGDEGRVGGWRVHENGNGARACMCMCNSGCGPAADGTVIRVRRYKLS